MYSYWGGGVLLIVLGKNCNVSDICNDSEQGHISQYKRLNNNMQYKVHLKLNDNVHTRAPTHILIGVTLL